MYISLKPGQSIPLIKLFDDSRHNATFLHVGRVVSIWVKVQPMRGGVTKWEPLSLAKPIPRMIPVVQYINLSHQPKINIFKAVVTKKINVIVLPLITLFLRVNDQLGMLHDDVIKWKRFPRNWPFVREVTGHRWLPRTKANDAEFWCFLWSAPWINGWVNNRDAGDLRRHRAHYDVIVMVRDDISCFGLFNISIYKHIYMHTHTYIYI